MTRLVATGTATAAALLYLVGCSIITGGSLQLGGMIEMTNAFVPPHAGRRKKGTSNSARAATVPPTTMMTDSTNSVGNGVVDTRSFLLPEDNVRPIIKIGSGEKQKIINMFGLWAMVVSLLTGPPWLLAMKLVQRLENDQNRELFDMTGKIWAKTWLTLTNSYPSVSVSF
jgi:hypothetical protein